MSHDEPGWAVIPRPVKTEHKDGRFALNSPSIIADDDSAETAQTARQLAHHLRETTGANFTLGGDTTGGAILLTLAGADASLGPEGYELSVEPGGITLRAPEPAGLFYAAQTLRQLAAFAEAGDGLGCVRITDRPRFPWRGFMLDSARHIQEADVVERLLDRLAYYKINRFHWHLNDDEAWRIEIEKYPKLTEIGAFPSSGQESCRGFYTKDQIRHIVEYARERFIMVIPEIEIPGHASAALYCYPEFTCKGEPFPHGPDAPWYFQGEAGRQAYCAGRPETFEFLTDVLSEVMELFDTPYIHVGGDERPREAWSECPLCRKAIEDNGLADEDELQNWLMARVAAFVRSHGRRPIAWAAGLEAGIPEGQIVQGWHKGESEYAAQQGAEVINSQHDFCYLDYPFTDAGKETSPDWMPVMDLRRVYAFDPVTPDVGPEHAANVIGSEAPLWAEMISGEAAIYRQAFPRMLAFSEVVWTPQAARDFDEFEPRARKHAGSGYFERGPD